MLFASRNVDPYLDAYVLSRRKASGDSIYTELAELRKTLYQKGATENIIKGSTIKVRNFRLFVSMVIPCEKTPQGYEKCITEHVDKYREGLRSVLFSLNMGPTAVPPEKLNTVLMEILNPGHKIEESSYDTTVPLRDQVIYADTEIHVESDHIKLDKYFCQSMTVKQYPEEWSMAKCINFTGSLYENAKQIGVPFMLVMNCEYPDQVKDGASVQKKALAAKYQSFGAFAKWLPQVVNRKNNFDILSEAMENESLFYGYFNIFFFAKTKKQMYDINQSFQSLYRSMGVILQDDPYISLPLFLQMLPMGYNHEIQGSVRRRNTRTTGIIAELLPIYADGRGCGGDPVIQLVSRRGQLQYFDQFSNTKGGYSSVIVAATGGGKSFFVNDMTAGYLGLGTKIWTIDVGRSYEKLCEFVGGQFINFSTDSDMCLNPFTWVQNLSEEMPMLKSLVAQMASREPMDDLNLAFIEEAIREVFQEHGNDMNVTALTDFLSTQNDSRQKELAMRLYPYSRKGAYSKLFNGRSTVEDKADYIVYELEELKSKKDLQEVVLLALVYQIQQDMLKKDRKKLIIIDEAFDLLTGGNTTSFIETAYRRYRKYQGACCTITQSINDFYNIPPGVAILENSSYFYLLPQRAESIEALKRSGRLALDEMHYDFLRSVHTDIGNYSGVFAYTPEGVYHGRLIVDRFTQLLYSSKADEFMRYKHYRAQGLRVQEALYRVMEEEQRK
jgi:conjugal transfer ATP-binding protein TraC